MTGLQITAVTLLLVGLRLWLDLASPGAESAAALQARFSEPADPSPRAARASW